MSKLFVFLLLFICNLAFSQDSLNIQLLFHWDDPSIPPTGFYGNKYNEVWGIAQAGREYAIIGSTMGANIFDITDPINAQFIQFVGGKDYGTQIVHRDYHDFNGYLYAVSDEGAASLQIMDLSYLPDSVHVVYDSDSLITTSHNICIDTSSARLYACGMVNGLGQPNYLACYSLANPVSPVLLSYYNAIDYYHDVFVYNDTVIGNNGNYGMSIVDFSNPSSPQIISTLTAYPDKGYNHSGYTTEDHKTYVMSDENHGYKMKLVDISDPFSPTILSVLWSGVDVNSMAHNQIIKGNILYVSSYHDGLYMYNISNPTNPIITGYYDTYLPADHASYRGAWGVYPLLPSGNVLISDMQTGLYVFNVSQALGLVDGTEAMEDIEVFPNPFVDKVIIHFDNNSALPIRYCLRGITGNLLQSGTLIPDGSGYISLQFNNTFAQGVYFISLLGEDNIKTLKIIKQ